LPIAAISLIFIAGSVIAGRQVLKLLFRSDDYQPGLFTSFICGQLFLYMLCLMQLSLDMVVFTIHAILVAAILAALFSRKYRLQASSLFLHMRLVFFYFILSVPVLFVSIFSFPGTTENLSSWFFLSKVLYFDNGIAKDISSLMVKIITNHDALFPSMMSAISMKMNSYWNEFMPGILRISFISALIMYFSEWAAENRGTGTVLFLFLLYASPVTGLATGSLASWVPVFCCVFCAEIILNESNHDKRITACLAGFYTALLHPASFTLVTAAGIMLFAFKIKNAEWKIQWAMFSGPWSLVILFLILVAHWFYPVYWSFELADKTGPQLNLLTSSIKDLPYTRSSFWYNFFYDSGLFLSFILLFTVIPVTRLFFKSNSEFARNFAFGSIFWQPIILNGIYLILFIPLFFLNTGMQNIATVTTAAKAAIFINALPLIALLLKNKDPVE